MTKIIIITEMIHSLVKIITIMKINIKILISIILMKEIKKAIIIMKISKEMKMIMGSIISLIKKNPLTMMIII